MKEKSATATAQRCDNRTFLLKLKELLLNHMLIVLLVLLAIVTAIKEPRFLLPSNLTNIMRQFGPLSFVALGMTMSIICGYIDLSVPGMINICAVLTVYMVNPLGQYGSILFVVLFGALAGMINGFLITASGGYTQAEGLFLTFGMSQVWSAVAMLVSGGSTQQLRWCERPTEFISGMGTFALFDVIPFAMLLFVVVMVLLNFYHKRTYPGRAISVAGGNKVAAKLAGINVDTTIIRTMAISGMMTALGAIMLVSRVTNASPTVGQDYDNDAIISVVVGGTALSGGKGSVFGTMLGVLLVTMLSNCMNMLHVSTHMQRVMRGAILILAIWADSRKNRQTK